ncbi:efflux RND transporter periplasmic adaptor subunit [Methylovirgula sp. 4M-Z18]|uniref:efflux RND transporter periplasmic adaptor subunit n=1 Tax=Methylovirgula sp. 4M-Z18 TaxID=2293567 RepID=UPI000E2F145F|nr:efflux RND transporter periplasmic adaptor subunit [Methylovirgula sp. 4M-Z18]RFB79418.1 efflux RND transporter periplasmic adaptor subunit [Methylovirgula sp. 4M-Z18]
MDSTTSRVKPKKSGSKLFLATVILAAGVGGYAYWQHMETQRQAQEAAARAAAAPPPAVPVTIAKAAKSDVRVFLPGLGTVQALTTVTVRSRVDGEIHKIAYKEGQFVNKGDLLAQIDPRPFQAALEQATAKKSQDQANLANAQLDLVRYQKLGQFASGQQLDTQKSTVNQLTAQIAADQAAIDAAQTQLDYTTIRAPLTGKTGFTLVDEGNMVSAAGQSGIVVIQQMQPITVVFTEPERYLGDINAAMREGEPLVEAYTADGKKKLAEGVLTLVDNQVDVATGSIHVRATFDNKDDALWPGLSVTTRLLAKTLQGVVTVPDGTIQHGPNGLFAFVVDDQSKAQVQPIEIGQSEGGATVVTKGIAEGQSVVTAGQYRLQRGTLVSNQEVADSSSQ